MDRFVINEKMKNEIEIAKLLISISDNDLNLKKMNNKDFGNEYAYTNSLMTETVFQNNPKSVMEHGAQKIQIVPAEKPKLNDNEFIKSLVKETAVQHNQKLDLASETGS